MTAMYEDQYNLCVSSSLLCLGPFHLSPVPLVTLPKAQLLGNKLSCTRSRL
uniref:Uncharacterized protein n=1 Tax=Arundo donax TaxID=35708 RepID=A0A0A8YNQ9_ARUDO